MSSGVSTHTLYAVRHLAARDPIFPGHELVLPDLGPAIVGKGVHPDGEPHLEAAEFCKAEALGEAFQLPAPD